MVKTGKAFLLVFFFFRFFFGVSYQVDYEPKKIGLDDQVNLTITLTKEGSPKIESQDFISSGVTSHQRFMSIDSSGVAKVNIKLGYVLQPQRTGTLEFKVNLGNETQGPFKVTVLPGSLQAPSQAQKQTRRSLIDEFFGGPTQVNQIDYFYQYDLPKKQLYVHEPIILQLNLYTTSDFVRPNSFNTPPSFSGFASYQLTNVDFPTKSTMIKGKKYKVKNIINYMLYPTIAGSPEIRSAKINSVVQTGLFGGKQEQKRVPSKKVSAIYPPKLDSKQAFEGSIGQFTWNVSMDEGPYISGEPIQLKISLKGVGNIEKLQLPNFDELFDSRVKIKQAKAKTKYQYTKRGMEGRKFIDYYLIPSKAGKITLPELSFTFFNPVKKKYQTLKKNLDTIQVIENPLSNPKNNEVPKQLITPRFIKPKLESTVDSPIYLIFLSFSFFFICTAAGTLMYREKIMPKFQNSVHQNTIHALENCMKVENIEEKNKAIEILLVQYIKSVFRLKHEMNLKEMEKEIKTVGMPYASQGLALIQKIRGIQSQAFSPNKQHLDVNITIIKEIIQKIEHQV